jgi:Bacterial extracellular solute-binding proteins, family 5 Middle
MLVALGAVFALFAASDAGPASGTAAPRGGTLRVIDPMDIVSLDPALNMGDFAWALEDGTCATLMIFRDAAAPEGVTVQPEAATGPPAISRDGRTYTFRVRPGLRFSNGSPLSARNFARALGRVLDPVIAGQVDAARVELRRAEERLERVRRDYLDGKLTAERGEEFFAQLEPEREAAAAALDQLYGQAEATRNEATVRDAEAETLAALQAIRGALAGLVAGAADMDAARLALRRVFESFTLHRYEDIRSGIVEADLAAGDWYIVPTVRADAILSPLVIGRDDHDEPTIEQAQELRRVPVSSGEKLSSSPPSISQFFGVIRVAGQRSVSPANPSGPAV